MIRKLRSTLALRTELQSINHSIYYVWQCLLDENGAEILIVCISPVAHGSVLIIPPAHSTTKGWGFTMMVRNWAPKGWWRLTLLGQPDSIRKLFQWPAKARENPRRTFLIVFSIVFALLAVALLLSRLAHPLPKVGMDSSGNTHCRAPLNVLWKM